MDRRHWVVEGYAVTLLPKTPGTRVPVKYPTGTWIQKYPKVRALVSVEFVSEWVKVSLYTSLFAMNDRKAEINKQKLDSVAKPSLMAIWVVWIETTVLFFTVYGPKFTDLSTHVWE